MTNQPTDDVASAAPQRRLFRSAQDRKLAGVCGGIAEYFSIDPTIVRLGVVAFTLFNPTTVLAYLIAAFVIPDSPARYMQSDPA